MRKFNLLILFLIICALSNAQNKDNTYTIMSYNVENLYDTIDNDHVDDAEFLPESRKDWNTEKYFNKLNNIARVIKAVNDVEYPEIVSLIEIENYRVVFDLINKTNLKKANYGIVQYKSADPRGVGVALIYRKDAFKLVTSKPFSIVYNEGQIQTTRHILYVKGLIDKNDTIHILVNHWKSRRGKDEETENKRIKSASIVRHIVDSLQMRNKDARIVILGDFNDEPTNISLADTLRAGNKKTNLSKGELYNLMYDRKLNKDGTTFYRSGWSMLDNIIVSYSVITSKKSIYKATWSSGYILKKDFMLKTDKNGFQVPLRTFEGKKYMNGYSDHLPVYMILKK